MKLPFGARMDEAAIAEQDRADLHRMGYAQQLVREMGGFSNFAVSFSIISILTGAILLFGFGLRFAGPIINTVGWPLVSLLVLTVAASMAELSSAYPTAGGLYYWAFRLGDRRWAWVTAWFNMIGQISITSGVNIAAAMYFVGTATRIFGIAGDSPIPIFGSLTNWYFYVFVAVLITVAQALINIYGIKLTSRLNNASVWWHMAGVAFIVGALLVLGKTHRGLDFAFLAVTTTNPLEYSSVQFPDGSTAPGLNLGNPITQQPLAIPSPLFLMFPMLTDIYRAAPLWLVMAIGLLQAQWTFTGYDASAHVAEETRMARLNVAWGVFLSVLVSAVVGYILVMVLTLSVVDLAATSTDPYPVLKVAYDNLPEVMGHGVAIFIAGAMWLCGLASITGMSRMWFAFARDEGVPGHQWLCKIHPHWRTPINATVATCALAMLLLLWSGAFYIVTAISVVFLYWSYGIPIYLHVRNRRRARGEYITPGAAAWNLGRWSSKLNSIAVTWIAIISVIMVLPPNELVLWTVVLICAFMALYWRLSVSGRFVGPRPHSEEELEAIEETLAAEDQPTATM